MSRSKFPRKLERPYHIHAAGNACKNAFFPRKATSHLAALTIIYTTYFVIEVLIQKRLQYRRAYEGGKMLIYF